MNPKSPFTNPVIRPAAPAPAARPRVGRYLLVVLGLVSIGTSTIAWQKYQQVQGLLADKARLEKQLKLEQNIVLERSRTAPPPNGRLRSRLHPLTVPSSWRTIHPTSPINPAISMPGTGGRAAMAATGLRAPVPMERTVAGAEMGVAAVALVAPVVDLRPRAAENCSPFPTSLLHSLLPWE